ncbi:MAG TPA: YbaK/EbsC family protein [Acidimicrobiales bacterium]|nr:YbaK/EbsC family protein [Acidimicrobiales bacterium]
MIFELGELSGEPAGERPDLLAPTTADAIAVRGLGSRLGVVEIDPEVSDTAASQKAFGLPPDALANCVVVGGKREGQERIAACLILATTKADVNNAVRRLLDVRKASFLAMERAVELTGMEYGGITPIGLPPDWPVFVDRAVTDRPLLVIGSGVRRSKLLAPGQVLGSLPGAQVVDGLGLAVSS